MEASDLDASENAADDQSRRYQVLGLFVREIHTARHDPGRADDTPQHSEGMLDTQQHGQDNGDLVVEAEEGHRARCLLEKGDVRQEESAVVIVADQTVLGSEGLPDGA